MATVNKNFVVKNSVEAQSFIFTTSISSTIPGQLTYNADAGTVEFELKDGNIVHRIGQQEVIRVENTTGSTIGQGSVVYISGSSGFLPRITKASATGEGTSSKTFGLVASDGGIADQAEGYVVTSGLIRGVNTDGIAAGTALWLGTTAGTYVTTRPTQPDHGVFVGWVVKSGINGEILVKIQNGFELYELHNVLLATTSSIADNEVLAFDTTSGMWINQTAAEAGLATASHTHALDDLSDVTITAATTGQVLKFNGTVWINDTDATGGGSGITVSDTAPVSPSADDLWFDSTTGRTYIYYDSFWVEIDTAQKGDTGAAGDSTWSMGGFESGGIYYSPVQGSNNSNVTATEDRTEYLPFYVPVTTTFDRLAIFTSSAFVPSSSPGTFVRLGIYNNSTNRPSTVLLDAGTVNVLTSSSTYTITIDQTLNPGWYWLAFNMQSIGTGGTHSFSGINLLPTWGYMRSNLSQNRVLLRQETGITGAFATAGTLNNNQVTIAPAVYLRTV